jgi:ABC-2 type transport system ATP-binding protein
MMDDLAIDVRGLVKQYGAHRALDGLDLAVPRGAVAGFAGLNGAGKTTTMRILLQMARADAGSARVLSLDAADRLESLKIRGRTAFVAERKDLFPYMRVREAICFTKSFYPKWRNDLEKKYTAEFELRLEQRVTQLSKGTLTKLQLLLAFCRGAELLLLDEPTDGLDPLGTELVMQAIVGLAAEEGVTVLFSSHRLNEMEQIADYLCLIHKGRTMMSGPIDELKAACRRVVMVFDGDAGRMAREFAGIGPVKREGRTLTVLARDGSGALMERAERLGARSVELEALSLREMFLELVKGDLR